MSQARTYLDWNASSPLREEAKDAMRRAMESLGNPASVHSEGRSARAIIETARRQIAAAVGSAPDAIVFTSGATEAAALALSNRSLARADIEHDCVAAWGESSIGTQASGQVSVPDPANATLQLANSETGIVQNLPKGIAFTDAVQAFGKMPWSFNWSGASSAALSAHKIGGPKGVGALILGEGVELEPLIKGGGQELGRRSGTENLIGIAGFGAAAEAAMRDLEEGAWERVAKLRTILEETLATANPNAIFVGRETDRLPNTSCIICRGWKGETQVMVMDLAGFAISAGSACSSGKVTESRVIRAMGYDEDAASSAIRVSLGPTHTEADIRAFADAWGTQFNRWKQRAA